MIINYKFENFASFNEVVEFSMLTPKTKVKNRFPNNFTIINDGTEILKTAVIVGENAGGKSNFVRSLRYLQTFFEKTESAAAYKNTINTNNSISSCPKKNNSIQTFDLEVFVHDKGFYLYHLEIDIWGIVKETLQFKDKYKHKYNLILSAIRKSKTANCQSEDDNCIKENSCELQVTVEYTLEIPELNPQLKASLKKAVQNQKPIGLFITKLAFLSNEHAVCFTEWIKNSLCPETNDINYGIYKSIKKEDDDLRILNDPRYLDIFKMIDYSIIGFELDDEQPFSKTLIIRRKKDGTTFSRQIAHDSSGVSEFFAWAIQIFKVVYEDNIVFADEMDRVLNPILSDRVLSFISGKKHLGQFVFTTHNVLHLDLKNYMKEQIYFVTKDIETLESEMYSLADFPEIRYETTKIYEFYMKGILGGTAFE